MEEGYLPAAFAAPVLHFMRGMPTPRQARRHQGDVTPTPGGLSPQRERASTLPSLPSLELGLFSQSTSGSE